MDPPAADGDPRSSFLPPLGPTHRQADTEATSGQSAIIADALKQGFDAAEPPPAPMFESEMMSEAADSAEKDEEDHPSGPKMRFLAPGSKISKAKRAQIQTDMKSMKEASRCFPMLLEMGMEAEKAGDKVEEELSSLSVVNGLLTIVTFFLLTAVPDSMEEPQNLPSKRAYGIITGTAMMFNLASVVLTTLLKKSMNCVVDKGGISRQYVLHFSSDLTEGCAFFFVGGIILMLVSILMFAYFRYGGVVCWVAIAISAVSLITVVISYLLPHRVMVAAIRRQFEVKMATFTRQPLPECNGWKRRVWDQGIFGLCSKANKVHEDSL